MKRPLSLEDQEGHGVIIRNDTLKKLLKYQKNLNVFKSKVIKTENDQYYRYLYLEDGTKIKLPS